MPAVEASAFVGLVVPGEIAVLVGGVVAHGEGFTAGDGDRGGGVNRAGFDGATESLSLIHI